jgi:hypothetical protein
VNDRHWRVIVQVYDFTNRTLWALLITYVIYFVVFTLPNLPKIWARIDRIRVQEIAAEDALYCEKLKMKAHTPSFDECLLILGDFRVKVEKRLNEENSF